MGADAAERRRAFDQPGIVDPLGFGMVRDTFSDNWWLTLEVEDLVDNDAPPVRATLLEGAGASPPEDCGGVHGYQLLVAAAAPTHPDHRQALEVAAWWGREVASDEVGLVPFDAASVAGLLTGLGWAVGDGQPIDRRTVTGLIAADVDLLRQLGAFERDRRGGWLGTVAPDGIALARASLNPREA